MKHSSERSSSSSARCSSGSASANRSAPGVLRGRLAVGVEQRRAAARGGRIPKDGLRVARGLRVVREAREVLSGRPRGQRGQDRLVQLQPPAGRDRLLDGEPRELVAEREDVLDRRAACPR